VVRQRFAKPLYAGSNPVLTSELSRSLSQEEQADRGEAGAANEDTRALRDALRAATEAGAWETVAELARLLAGAKPNG
jgi:hypothetical protein